MKIPVLTATSTSWQGVEVAARAAKGTLGRKMLPTIVLLCRAAEEKMPGALGNETTRVPTMYVVRKQKSRSVWYGHGSVSTDEASGRGFEEVAMGLTKASSKVSAKAAA